MYIYVYILYIYIYINVTSKKFTIFRFFSLVMLSLNSVLNIEMKSFRIRSGCDPLIFPKHAKPF